jgi:hypothetical protein
LSEHIPLVSRKVPITRDNLPEGLQWEEDGACWRAERDNYDPRGWRWSPRNYKAFAKEEPEGPMTDFVRPLNLGHSISTGTKRNGS